MGRDQSVAPCALTQRSLNAGGENHCSSSSHCSMLPTIAGGKATNQAGIVTACRIDNAPKTIFMRAACIGAACRIDNAPKATLMRAACIVPVAFGLWKQKHQPL